MEEILKNEFQKLINEKNNNLQELNSKLQILKDKINDVENKLSNIKKTSDLESPKKTDFNLFSRIIFNSYNKALKQYEEEKKEYEKNLNVINEEEKNLNNLKKELLGESVKIENVIFSLTNELKNIRSIKLDNIDNAIKFIISKKPELKKDTNLMKQIFKYDDLLFLELSDNEELNKLFCRKKLRNSKVINNEFLEKYLEENKEKFYEVIIEEKKYNIKVEDMINYMLLSSDFNKNNKYNFYGTYVICKFLYNDIDPLHFEYATYKFFEENFNNINLGADISSRLDELSLKAKKLHLGEYFKTDDNNISNIKLNQELIDYVLKDMPENYSKFEKTIFIYIKLCKTLSYDDEYLASPDKDKEKEKHRDITRISEITPENNKIVCFEFTAIYEKLLNESLGIPTTIKYGNTTDEYGIYHNNVIFKDRTSIIHIDPLNGVYGSDLVLSKINSRLYGISIEESNMNIFQSLNNSIQRVYDYINDKEKEKNDKFHDILDSYNKISDNLKIVSQKEKLDILIEEISSSKFKTTDSLGYLLKLSGMLFDKTNFFINFVRDNKAFNDDNKDYITAIIALLDNDEMWQLYTYKIGGDLIPTTKETLKSKIEKNELEPYDYSLDKGRLNEILEIHTHRM